MSLFPISDEAYYFWPWWMLFFSVIGIKITVSFTDIWNYTCEVNRKAWQDSLRPSVNSANFISLIASFVALLALYLIFGPEATMEQLVYGVVAIMLAVFIRYLWSVVHASALLDKVQKQRIKELEDRIKEFELRSR